MPRIKFQPGEQVVLDDSDDATVYMISAVLLGNRLAILDSSSSTSKEHIIDASRAKYPTLKQLTGE